MARQGKQTGVTSNEYSIKTQMKNLICEYKAIYLQWLYAPELLPKHFDTFDELKDNFKMFPSGVTEEQAKVWLYEDTVIQALQLLLKAQHKQKMVELYNIYYERSKTDVQSFKAFVDFSDTFFDSNNGESELTALLKGATIE